MQQEKYIPQADLLLAITANDHAGVKKLLVAGADVNAHGKGGVAPVLLAAFLNQTEMVSLLASHGAHYPRWVPTVSLRHYPKPDLLQRPCEYVRGLSEDTDTVFDVLIAPITYGNCRIFQTLISLPGSPQGIMKKAALPAWTSAHFADESASYLGALSAGAITKNLSLNERDRGLLSTTLVKFFDATGSGLRGPWSNVPEWRPSDFRSDQNLFSLPFAFEYTFLSKKSACPVQSREWHAPNSSSTHFEWQPDLHSYVIGSETEATDSDENPYDTFCGTVLFSRHPETISKLSAMFAAIRKNDPEVLVKASSENAGQSFGDVFLSVVGSYAIRHCADKIISHLIEAEPEMRADSVIAHLFKELGGVSGWAFHSDEDYIKDGRLEQPKNYCYLDCNKLADIGELLIKAAEKSNNYPKSADFVKCALKWMLATKSHEEQDSRRSLFFHAHAHQEIMDVLGHDANIVRDKVRYFHAKDAREAMKNVIKSARSSFHA